MDATPSREVMWNIDHSLTWVMYLAFVVALGVCVYFFVRRWRVMSIGASVDRTSNWKQRALGMAKDALAQVRVMRKPGVGIMHLGMYVGMIIMLIATVATAIHFDLGIPLVQGDFYLYFLSLAVDLAGLAFCLAMVGCIIRRVVNKKLDTRVGDIIVLVLLLIIGITGFFVEGLRIEGTDDPWRAWSPIGNVTASLFVGLSAEQISLTHQLLWWFHMSLAFALIAYWTYSKLVHVLLIPAGVWCRPLEPKGTLPFIDVEDENLTSMGARALEDLTWKDLLDAEACIRCGRCEEVCPAASTGKALSPKNLVQGIHDELETRGPIVWKVRRAGASRDEMGIWAMPDGSAPQLDEAAQELLERPLVGFAIDEQALWDCTTCGACMEVCPTYAEQTTQIVKMRTYQVSMESAFPPEAQSTFRNLETNKNPWGLGWQTRSQWINDLPEGVHVPTIREKPDAEYLWWPGCSGAFDARGRKVSVALAKLMCEAGLSFAVLGNEEKCCGDAARRMGNEYVYYLLASENIATLQSYGVKKIITQCPHCAHVLSRDYPQLGGTFEVIHHSELLARLIKQGKIPRATDAHVLATHGGQRSDAAQAPARVAVHDSCYLGRYRSCYDEPREVVRASAAQVVELTRARDKSFCCGAGGGRMWLEDGAGVRMGDVRAREALASKPDAIATACPFCLTMLSDGVASMDDETPVYDIAELFAQTRP